MKRCRLLLTVVLLAMLTRSAMAGIFSFGKTSKNPSADRVPAFIVTLKTSQDAAKREEAAKQLRYFDPNVYPQIVPALAESVLGDPKTGVRIEAIISLSKLRPVSQEAGSALEMAMAKDPSMRVRFQARTSLWQYYLAGYRGSKEQPPTNMRQPANAPTTNEPPLADPLPTTFATPAQTFPGPVVSSPPILHSSNPPRMITRPTGSFVPSSTAPPVITTAEPPLLDPSSTSPPVDGPDLGVPR